MRTFLGAAIAFSFVTISAANAATVFDVTSSNNLYSGSVTIDTVAGDITSADLVVPPGVAHFTNIIPSPIQSPTTLTAGFGNGTVSPIAIIFLVIADGGSLVGYTGGAIDDAFFSGLCGLTGQCRGTPDDLGAGELTAQSSSTTPLPSTLLLFATGLGGLGFLGWSTKRKAAAA